MAVADFLAALSGAPSLLQNFDQTRQARGDRALSQSLTLNEESRAAAREARLAEQEARQTLLEQLSRRPRNESGELIIDASEAPEVVKRLGKGAVVKRPDGSLIVNPTAAEEQAAAQFARGKRADELALVQDPVLRKELAQKARKLDQFDQFEASLAKTYGPDWRTVVEKLPLAKREAIGRRLGEDLTTATEKAMSSASVIAQGVASAASRHNANLDFQLGVQKAQIDAMTRRGELEAKDATLVTNILSSILRNAQSTFTQLDPADALRQALTMLPQVKAAASGEAPPPTPNAPGGTFRVVSQR